MVVSLSSRLESNKEEEEGEGAQPNATSYMLALSVLNPKP